MPPIAPNHPNAIAIAQKRESTFSASPATKKQQESTFPAPATKKQRERSFPSTCLSSSVRWVAAFISFAFTRRGLRMRSHSLLQRIQTNGRANHQQFRFSFQAEVSVLIFRLLFDKRQFNKPQLFIERNRIGLRLLLH